MGGGIRDDPGAAARSADRVGGGAETQSQVNLRFPTAEAAIAYCEREDRDLEVIPAPRRKLLLQSYADNFR